MYVCVGGGGGEGGEPTNLVVHEIVEVFHHYLFQHVNISDHDVWFLSNVESVFVEKRMESALYYYYIMEFEYSDYNIIIIVIE